MTAAGPSSLLEAAASVLSSGTAAAKIAAAQQADRLRTGGAPLGEAASLPERPARPPLPLLAPPGGVPRRRLGSAKGRAALLHALAHIEFNAIDLAFDMAARFAGAIEAEGLDAAAFTADWIGVGGEEARHFGMVAARLDALGCSYGDLLAHDGLWEAAAETNGDVLARLAIAPLVLEARGLDVTPDMAARLRAAGDMESAAILDVIYRDEVGHVACGKRWFDAVCAARGLDPVGAFHALRKAYFAGRLKPPFNHEARSRAGLPREFYEPIGNESSV